MTDPIYVDSPKALTYMPKGHPPLYFILKSEHDVPKNYAGDSEATEYTTIAWDLKAFTSKSGFLEEIEEIAAHGDLPSNMIFLQGQQILPWLYWL